MANFTWKAWRGATLFQATKKCVRVALVKTASGVTKTTKVLAPRGATAFLRNSIGMSKVRELADKAEIDVGVLGGRQGSPDQYAVYVEEGRKPGKQPPIAALMLWVKRVLKPTVSSKGLLQKARRVAGRSGNLQATRKLIRTRKAESVIRSVAFLVARAIGKRGIKPVHMFRRAFELHKHDYAINLKAAYQQATNPLPKVIVL